ncbi:Lrp/AsnC family transcriptional regulator [Paludibacter jiangxiensis]|jgi:Lrp/AsnC family transcriptional regulator for asnA, asnC and gidA|uniref:Lrp/AsnC family transcriptional regulator n=1 Tax=Paludibacter jiangxiensis TaxID=681398 RepID=A0A161LI94_9BACT|nr:Lrp/AsnC ligand binding domain-containing protein [Paludibacter jiangxiensis]MDP4202447.1 Lrp/AsnC ligand binding domain-containing protein [Bacteroidota bacterium]GAT62066.1 Lrp/AsnC family transcriptional regulator [Paludibacter jiangxiensis]
MAHTLDKLDRKILHYISQNARTPFLEIARECNVSGAAIHQRVQKLVNQGVIRNSEFVIDQYKVGYQTCAYIGIVLKNNIEFQAVVDHIKEIPEIVECHYTTGKYAMFIKMYAKDNRHLLRLILDKISTIPGVANTETFQLSLEEIFRRQLSTFGVDEEK